MWDLTNSQVTPTAPGKITDFSSFFRDFICRLKTWHRAFNISNRDDSSSLVPAKWRGVRLTLENIYKC